MQLSLIATDLPWEIVRLQGLVNDPATELHMQGGSLSKKLPSCHMTCVMIVITTDNSHCYIRFSWIEINSTAKNEGPTSRG